MPDEFKTTPLPIRGWLILVAIILWGTSITSPIVLIVAILLYHIFPPLTEYEILIYSLGVSFLVIVTLVQFMKRKRRFVSWFMSLQIWVILHYFIFSFTGNKIHSNWLAAIVDFILILYVLRSTRVKETFVQ